MSRKVDVLSLDKEDVKEDYRSNIPMYLTWYGLLIF